MQSDFSRLLSLLRQERGISQRTAARDLSISQALLSHYENGIREPGLAFLIRACDYYSVSADYLLGRTLSRDGITISAETLYDSSGGGDSALKVSMLASLQKKLIVNATSVLFDLLGKTGCRDATVAASSFLGTAVYKLFRHLHHMANPGAQDFFSVPSGAFFSGVPEGDMALSTVDYVAALTCHAKEKNSFPNMSNDELAREYPVTYRSLLQILYINGERMIGRIKKG
ncbi:MAG: helix-turn-helix transcriptional regulator [Oscillospiraceae bacterium]|nr:helix-turn-helix transcriptional regulator [Oscillospiraceae bacterium]